MPEYTIGRFRNQLALVWYDAEGRHRYQLGTADPREAERRAPSLYAALTRPKGKSVEELWAAYCRDKAGRAVLSTMRHTWKALASGFAGDVSADTITVEDCRAHVERRRRAGIRDGTIHTELGHLRMVLVWACKNGYLDRAPHIERPPKPKHRERHLSRQQVRTLIDGARLPHVRLYCILVYTTAARNAALLELRWDRCDFETGRIDLRNPSLSAPHKGRAIVPMLRTARTALQEARQGALSDYVIEWAGKPVKSVKRGLAAAARRAGLPHVSPHDLRRSAAIHMAEDGVPMSEISQYLGHSNEKITAQAYARFQPDFLRKAASALEFDDLGPMKRKRA